VFHVPVVTASLGEVASAGLRLIGSSSHRGSSHTTADWSGRIAIVAGNEAAGLDTESVDEWVCIEHCGRAESLNVAMATTVLCFEALRRRAGGSPTSQ
jgi:TrmH family RNA methyltransferase